MPKATESLAQLRARFQNPSRLSRPTPLYWWSGSDLSIDRMIWHLDLLRDKGVGGTIICYAHRPDGSVDHESPIPFSDEWWSLLKEFVDASAERELSVGLCDYQVIGTILKRAASKTTGLNGGNLKNYFQTVTGPVEIVESVNHRNVLSRRAISPDGASVIDIARVANNEVTWSVPDGDWVLSTATVEPGRIYLDESRFDPLHPNAGSSVIDLFFRRFEEVLGSHLGTTFTTFFQDELELGLVTPMWNSLVRAALQSQGYSPLDNVHWLWHGSTDEAMVFRGAFRDNVVKLLQEHFFKPIFEWHEQHNTSLVMDQLSRGDLALGHEHYSDFMETMAWYQGPGNDDPDLTAPRNIPAFRTSSSIAHLNGRKLVTNEAFHSSGWGVTPQMILGGLNTDFAAGANQVILHGLDYSLESGWWEWASPDFHFRQPWWEHSAPMWRYLSRVSEMLQSGSSAVEIAVLDPTPELDFIKGSEAPGFASRLMEQLSLRGLGVDLVPQAYLGETAHIDEPGIQRLQARQARYSVVIIPNLKVIRAQALDAITSFASKGGIVINIGDLPERRDDRALSANDFAGWHCVANASELVERIHTLAQVDFKLEESSPNLLQSHRTVESSELYFLANPSDTPVNVKFDIRGESPIELWDAWSGESAPLAAELVDSSFGGVFRSASLELGPGQSALLVQSPEVKASHPATPLAVIDSLDISNGWRLKLASNLDNRYYDYALESKELPIASYHLEVSENPHTNWSPGLVDHGVRFLVQGPVAADETPAFEAQLFGANNSPADSRVGTWRGYSMSFVSGIPNDEYLQDRMTGPHGLKGVPDEFLDPSSVDKNAPKGTYYYFWSTVESSSETSVLLTSGRAHHKVWLNGFPVFERSEIPAGHFPPWHLRDMSSEVSETPISLTQGVNHVVIRILVSEDQPTRVAVVIGGNAPAKPAKAKLKWWQGDLPSRRFVPPWTRDEGWFKVQVPPGARTAFIPTKAKVTCTEGAEATPVAGGYEINVSSKTEFLIFKLNCIDQVEGELDAGAITGPISWQCEPASIDLQPWERLGLADFSGKGIYERNLDFGPSIPGVVELQLTDLVGTARVLVNGHEVGVCVSENTAIRIDAYLTPGNNRVVIESANTLVNLFSRLPSPYSIMQTPSGGFQRAVLVIKG